MGHTACPRPKATNAAKRLKASGASHTLRTEATPERPARGPGRLRSFQPLLIAPHDFLRKGSSSHAANTARTAARISEGATARSNFGAPICALQKTLSAQLNINKGRVRHRLHTPLQMLLRRRTTASKSAQVLIGCNRVGD
jgi:hypothetical protein